ncbi:MAG: preprotein translocase subunit YajC [Armatimonadetes bacterium]|nr:preprotein translocase subunit YajC [Armatimonadota bacterium]MDW8122362.1 preprotein translocase subunit YajC [Armatimonadota bacterium]
MPGQEWTSILIILAVWGLLLWVLLLPQQRQRREREKFLASLKAGDEVATTGGICGRILSVDGDLVTLRIADGVTVKVLKSGIHRRLDKEESNKLKAVLKKGGG